MLSNFTFQEIITVQNVRCCMYKVKKKYICLQMRCSRWASLTKLSGKKSGKKIGLVREREAMSDLRQCLFEHKETWLMILARAKREKKERSGAPIVSARSPRALLRDERRRCRLGLRPQFSRPAAIISLRRDRETTLDTFNPFCR